MAQESLASLSSALANLIERVIAALEDAETKINDTTTDAQRTDVTELHHILTTMLERLTSTRDGLPEALNPELLRALASKIKLEETMLDALIGLDQRQADLTEQQLKFVTRLLFETPGGQRYTQDSPILPSVLTAYALEPHRQQELILTVKGDKVTGHTAMRLRQMIKAFRKKQPMVPTAGKGEERRKAPRISYIPGQIAVRLYFDEMMRVVLPLTPWWHETYDALRSLERWHADAYNTLDGKNWVGFPMPDKVSKNTERAKPITNREQDLFEALMVMRREIDPAADNYFNNSSAIRSLLRKEDLTTQERREITAELRAERSTERLVFTQRFPQDFSWFVRVTGLIGDCFQNGTQILAEPGGLSAVLAQDFAARADASNSSVIETERERNKRIKKRAATLLEARKNRRAIARAFLNIYDNWFDEEKIGDHINDNFPTERVIWRITKNRPVHLAVTNSALTVKADAARRLFDVSCEKITWAILDSGIDTNHTAFRNTTQAHEEVMLRRARKLIEDDEMPELKPEELDSRVKLTLDFTRLRNLLEHDLDYEDESVEERAMPRAARNRRQKILEMIAERAIEGKTPKAAEDEADEAEKVAEKSEKAFRKAKDKAARSTRNIEALEAARVEAEREAIAARDKADKAARVLEEAQAAKGVAMQKAERVLDGLRFRIAHGQDINWRDLEDAIVVNKPEVPTNDHGTHVAGILGADWIEDFSDEHTRPLAQRTRKLVGICPEINLIDVRVFREDGLTDEFELLAAIQFLRWMNERAGSMQVHGANLSLSLLHEVQLFACGQTPICQECDEASALGMVIVAAAGNRGFARESTRRVTTRDHYQSVSITDPGNAASVITVGATHRKRPHEYGVSYFSSRGPTGDGRIKPDLVAPGEKIMGPTPNERMEVKDGTSMAAPHVSGVAAMLMARHTELVGQPARIKEILCTTAIDLGRERYFQGHGLVDALRALQSV